MKTYVYVNVYITTSFKQTQTTQCTHMYIHNGHSSCNIFQTISDCYIILYCILLYLFFCYHRASS